MRVRNTRTYKKVHIFSKNAAKIRKSKNEKSPTNGSVEPFLRLLSLEAPPRFELGDQSFADSCLTTWLWRHIQFSKKNGADDEARTRYLHLGKVALYQMSYIRTLLVPPAGIEPATRGFSVHCSTN